VVEIGKAPGSVVILHFAKAAAFGVMSGPQSGYDTIALPQATFEKAMNLYLFWPNDDPGDHWNHIKKIASEVNEVTSSVAGIAGNCNVVKIKQAGATLSGMPLPGPI